MGANAFQSAVKRAEIFARDTPSRILRITPDASSGGTLIYSEAETGRGDTLLAEAAMPIPMAFNNIFVHQGLEAIQASPVHIRLNASNAPILLSNGTDAQVVMTLTLFFGLPILVPVALATGLQALLQKFRGKDSIPAMLGIFAGAGIHTLK